MSMDPGLRALELHNSHSVTDLAAIATPDRTFEWGEEGKEQSMSWADYVQVVNHVVEAFPEIYFAWSDTVELRDDTVTSKVQVSGTHTGAPYSIGPFPPIEATGIKCQNDPEYVEIDKEGGKLKRMKVIPTKGSAKTGPPGFYLQIGRFMEAPDETKKAAEHPVVAGSFAVS